MVAFDHGATAVGTEEASGIVQLTIGMPDVQSAESLIEILRIDHGLDASLRTVDESWKAQSISTMAVTTTRRFVVAAPGATVEESAREVIRLDPGAAFGHGGHPTTSLMLRLLDGIDLAGTRVLDLGSGTGVLAIAAAKGGATEVLAIDTDHEAVESTRANVDRNGVSSRVDVRRADGADIDLRHIDLVLANVTLDVQRLIAPTVRSVPRLVVSGVLCGQVSDTRNAHRSHDARHILTFGSWAAIRFCASETRSQVPATNTQTPATTAPSKPKTTSRYTS